MKQKTASVFVCLVFVMTLLLAFVLPAQQPTFAAGETRSYNFTPNYMGQFVGMLPEGFSGNNFKMGTWANFEGASWGPGETSTAIYDKIIWTGTLNYSFSQINVYGGTGYLYFCYQNNDNYYAVALGSDTKLVKKVDGVQHVIAEHSQGHVSREQSINIIYNEAGEITVSVTPKNSGTILLFSRVKDDTFKQGKIGMGFVQGGGYYSSIRAIGTELVSARPSPIPLPTTPPRPTPTPFQPSGLLVTADAATNARLLGGATVSGDVVELSEDTSGLEFYVDHARLVSLEVACSGAGEQPVCYGIYLDDATAHTLYSTSNSQTHSVVIADYATPGRHKVKVVKLSGEGASLSVKTLFAYGDDHTTPTIAAE